MTPRKSARRPSRPPGTRRFAVDGKPLLRFLIGRRAEVIETEIVTHEARDQFAGDGRAVALGVKLFLISVRFHCRPRRNPERIQGRPAGGFLKAKLRDVSATGQGDKTYDVVSQGIRLAAPP